METSYFNNGNLYTCKDGLYIKMALLIFLERWSLYWNGTFFFSSSTVLGHICTVCGFPLTPTLCWWTGQTTAANRHTHDAISRQPRRRLLSCQNHLCQCYQCECTMVLLVQYTPDISRSCISRNWIYRGCMLDPIFGRPRARYFSQNRGNSLDSICGRQFFVKSAHRDSLCSRFAGDNFSRNYLWPTCQCELEHMLCDGQPSSAEHWHLHCVAE